MASQRTLYFDAVRATVSVLVVIYHVARTFTPGRIDSPIGVGLRSASVVEVADFINLFQMPLFLIASGYFAHQSYSTRPLREYARGRLLRIGLPLASCLALTFPLQRGLELMRRYGPAWDEYFIARVSPIGDTFNLGHLWYLYYMLVYSLVVATLAPRLSGLPFVGKLFRWITGTGPVAAMLLFWLPLHCGLLVFGFLVQHFTGTAPNGVWLPYMPMLDLLPFFVFGYLAFHHTQMLERLRGCAWGGLAACGAAAIGLHLAAAPVRELLSETTSVGGLVGTFLGLPLRWFTTLLAIRLAMQLYTKEAPWVRYLDTASYPIYLVHPLFLAVVGYLYVDPDLGGAWLSFGLMAVSTLGLTYGCYHWLLRRSQPALFLLTGAKPRKPASAA